MDDLASQLFVLKKKLEKRKINLMHYIQKASEYAEEKEDKEMIQKLRSFVDMEYKGKYFTGVQGMIMKDYYPFIYDHLFQQGANGSIDNYTDLLDSNNNYFESQSIVDYSTVYPPLKLAEEARIYLEDMGDEVPVLKVDRVRTNFDISRINYAKGLE